MAAFRFSERKSNILSRRQIEGLIADGKSVIIVDKMVLKVDGWLQFHPGGQKTIRHLIGKDATNEVNAMHSAETRLSMERFQIGRIEQPWENFIPPIQGGLYRNLSHACAEVDRDHETDRKCCLRNTSSFFDTDPNSAKEESPSRSPSPSVSLTTALRGYDGPRFLDLQTKREIDLDICKYPSSNAAVQDNIIDRYRSLEEQIRSEGLYNCNYTAYAWETGRCSLLFGLMLLFWQNEWYGTSAIFMGIFWSQLVFSAHDAGHIAITHNYTIDTIIGMVIAAPLGGLSLGWWKATHNVHHIVTNAVEHDPDNQHLPFLAVSHQFLGSIFSTYHERTLVYDSIARFMVPYQAYMYYPLLSLGRFNLYLQSYIFLLCGQGPRKGPAWWHRYFEVIGIVFFWLWYGWGIVGHIPGHKNRFIFVMVSHMVTLPLHVQFTVSHFAMSTTDLGPHESFPQRMLRTTMDVDCPQWLDFFHGGLQFQAVHHLFPRIPRHNLRRTQKLVINFCSEVGIPYALYGFVDGNKEVVGRLGEVARQAAILAKCQRTMAEKGEI